MTRLQGGRWLEVGASSDGTYSILDSGSLRRLTEQMPEPSQQFPALWVFLGSNRKTAALRMIFGDDVIGRTSTDGELRLRSDLASFTSRNPILFVESDPYRDPPVRRGKQPWQDLPIAWETPSASEVKTSLFTRLLFPFATVVCIFVDDFPFGENVASFLAKYRAATSFPTNVRPCLIVIYDTDKADTKIPHDWRTTERLSGTFSDIISVPLTLKGDSGVSRQYQDVQPVIAFHSQKVQDLRHETIARLSAIQMYKLFELATKHLAQTCEQPFDMIQASRRPGDIPRDLSVHLDYYRHLCLDAGLSDRDSAVSIASALIMDHYTPDMPRKINYYPVLN
jgi:rubredoxin